MFIYLSFLASFVLSNFGILRYINFIKALDQKVKTKSGTLSKIINFNNAIIPIFLTFWIVSFATAIISKLNCLFYIPLFIATNIILIPLVEKGCFKSFRLIHKVIELIGISIVVYFYNLRIWLPFCITGSLIIEEALSVLLTVLAGFFIIGTIKNLSAISSLSPGIIISIMTPLSIWFLTIRQKETAILCFSLIGGMFALARFKNTISKLKLEDCGNDFLGFVAFFMVMRFLSLSNFELESSVFSYPYVTILGILFVPIAEYSYTFIYSCITGKSPTQRNLGNIANSLINSGLKEVKVSNIIFSLNSVSIAFVIIFRNFSPLFQVLGLIIFYCLIRFAISKLEGEREFIPKFQNKKFI